MKEIRDTVCDPKAVQGPETHCVQEAQEHRSPFRSKLLLDTTLPFKVACFGCLLIQLGESQLEVALPTAFPEDKFMTTALESVLHTRDSAARQSRERGFWARP